MTRRVNKLKSTELLNINNQTHDIVLLCETWANELCDLQVDNFDNFVLNRSNNKEFSKRSSGGIIVYIRNEYACENTCVFCSEDDIICVKLSASKLTTSLDLFFCLCYVVPDNSSRQSLIDTHTFDRLLD